MIYSVYKVFLCIANTEERNCEMKPWAIMPTAEKEDSIIYQWNTGSSRVYAEKTVGHRTQSLTEWFDEDERDVQWLA